jgi:hypothetical protein
VKLGLGNPFPWAMVPSDWINGVLSSVLHVSKLVKPETGVIRGSDESRALAPTFSSGFCAVGVEASTGFAAALIVTPLFQTSFAPDLTQVNFLPLAVAVDPALVHFAPALTAANEGAVISEIERTKARRIRARVMAIRYQSTISS